MVEGIVFLGPSEAGPVLCTADKQQAILSTIVRTAELQTVFPSNDSVGLLKPKSFIDTVAYETKTVY